MSKTIDKQMVEILGEMHSKRIHANETELLDECAARLGANKLMELESKQRHSIILDALEKSPLFQKTFIRPKCETQRLGKCYLVV